MAGKITCPQCKESNYASSPACWACGAPLIGPRAADAASGAAQVETLLEAAPEVRAPQDAATEPPTEAEPDEPAPDTEAEGDAPGPKRAEREAQALRDKDYVTPPVETDERPRSLGEWGSYVVQMVGASLGWFRDALDEYDQRRGRRSGTMSSYGCLVTAVVAALCLALIAWMVHLLS